MELTQRLTAKHGAECVRLHGMSLSNPSPQGLGIYADEEGVERL